MCSVPMYSWLNRWASWLASCITFRARSVKRSYIEAVSSREDRGCRDERRTKDRAAMLPTGVRPGPPREGKEPGRTRVAVIIGSRRARTIAPGRPTSRGSVTGGSGAARSEPPGRPADWDRPTESEGRRRVNLRTRRGGGAVLGVGAETCPILEPPGVRIKATARTTPGMSKPLKTRPKRQPRDS